MLYTTHNSVYDDADDCSDINNGGDDNTEDIWPAESTLSQKYSSRDRGFFFLVFWFEVLIRRFFPLALMPADSSLRCWGAGWWSYSEVGTVLFHRAAGIVWNVTHFNKIFLFTSSLFRTVMLRVYKSLRTVSAVSSIFTYTYIILYMEYRGSNNKPTPYPSPCNYSVFISY